MGVLGSIHEYLLEFNMVSILFRVILSLVLGGIIGSERNRHGREAGLRTHILICFGSAMTALVSIFVIEKCGYDGDVFRIPASVVSGIGFLGAGMIITKNNGTISGLTTAAGMWATGSIGIAAGFGFYGGAVLGMVAIMITMTVLTKIEHKKKTTVRFYTEVSNASIAGEVTARAYEIMHHDMLTESVSPKTGISGHIGLYFTTSRSEETENELHALEKLEGVFFVVME